MGADEKQNLVPDIDLNFLTMCRRVQVVPGSLHAEQWPFLVTMLNYNGSTPLSSHASHSPSIERTENSIYAYAIACSRLDNNAYMPDLVLTIHKIFLPIVVIIGIVGNTFSANIMLHLGQSHMSVCLYAAVLSMLDSIILILPAGDLWMHVTFGYRAINRMLTYSNAFCNTYPFLFNFCIHLRAFLHLTIAVDIMLLHWRPIHYGQAMNGRRVRTVLLIYLVLLLTINSQFLWTYDVRKITSMDSIPKGNYCTYSVKWVDVQFRDIAWPVIDFSLGEALPFVIVTLSTGISLGLCWQSQRQPKKLLHRYIVDVTTFTQMLTTFLCLNTLFLCSVVPEVVFYALKYRAFTNRDEIQRQISNSFRSRSTGNGAPKVGHRDDDFLPQMMKLFIVPEILIVYMKFCTASCKFWLYFACSAYFRRHTWVRLRWFITCCSSSRNQPSPCRSSEVLREDRNGIEELFDQCTKSTSKHPNKHRKSNSYAGIVNPSAASSGVCDNSGYNCNVQTFCHEP